MVEAPDSRLKFCGNDNTLKKNWKMCHCDVWGKKPFRGQRIRANFWMTIIIVLH